MSTNFSKTAISTQGQKTGDLYVDEYCRIHNIKRPSFYKMLNDQDTYSVIFQLPLALL